MTHRTPPPRLSPHQALAIILKASGPWQAASLAARHPPPHVIPHQEEAAHALLSISSRYRGALLLDPVGAGKTHTALRWAELQQQPATILCPAPLKPMWNDRSPPGTPIHSLSTLSRRIPTIHTPLIIIDEAHHLRNPSTARYRNTASILPGRQVLLLTATPLHNAPADVTALLRLFQPPAFLDTFPSLPDALTTLAVRRSRARTHRPRTTRRIDLPTRNHAPLLLRATRALCGPTDPFDLLHTLLERRYLSSPRALYTTLRHARALLIRQLEAAHHGRLLDRSTFHQLFPDEAHLRQSVFPFLFDNAPPADPSLRHNLQERLSDLSDILQHLSPDPPDAFAHLLPHLDHPGHHLLFTDYLPTAHALFDTLHNQRPTLLVTGAGAHASRIGTLPPQHALSIFRKGHSLLPPGPRTLITTRVASEGLDLPEASLLAHIDLPWTAAALEQRRGRLDRPTCTEPYLELVCTPPRLTTPLHRKDGHARLLLHTLEHFDNLRQLDLPSNHPPILTLTYALEDAVILSHPDAPIAVTWRDGWVRLDTTALLSRLHLRAPHLHVRPATPGESLRARVAARETSHWQAPTQSKPIPSHLQHLLSQARLAWDAGRTSLAQQALQHDLPILHIPLTPAARTHLAELPPSDPTLLHHYQRLGTTLPLSTWNGVALVITV